MDPGVRLRRTPPRAGRVTFLAGGSTMRPVSTAEDIVTGALVTWGPHEQLGVVHKIEIDGDGGAADVAFDDGTHMFIKTNAGVLRRLHLAAGDQVMRGDGQVGVVLEQVSAGE